MYVCIYIYIYIYIYIRLQDGLLHQAGDHVVDHGLHLSEERV